MHSQTPTGVAAKVPPPPPTDGSGDGAVQVDGDTEVGCTVLTGDDAASAIDYDMLKRRDPIAWFDEVLLFEDELHDCGHAAASVKVVSCAALHTHA